jgi:hypothetical protein
LRLADLLLRDGVAEVKLSDNAGRLRQPEQPDGDNRQSDSG